jgi:hypothetical protein
MTDNEIIDQILYKMEPDVNHGYFNLWTDISKATLHDIRWAVKENSKAGAILKKMVKRDLVSLSYSGEEKIEYALIKLKERALKLRDNETWVNNVRKGVLTPKKTFFLRNFIEWIAIITTIILFSYFIYDRYWATKDGKNEETKTIKELREENTTDSQAVDHPDKNFSLIEDFEKSKDTFRPDTFNLNNLSTDGGQLIAYHTKDKNYLVLDIWLFGETGKIHSTYWTERNLNLKIVKRTDFVYDKPYYEKGYKTVKTSEFFSYTDNSFKRYRSDRQEINDSDNGNQEKKVRDLLTAISKEVKIIK